VWKTRRIQDFNAYHKKLFETSARRESLIEEININLSTYQLRDYFEDEETSPVIMGLFNNLFEAIWSNGLYTHGFPRLHTIVFVFNQFVRNQQFNHMNTETEIRFTRLLQNLNTRVEGSSGISNLKVFRTVGQASEEMLEEVSKLGKLTDLQIRNCPQIEGNSLAKSETKNSLTKLNLMGSY